VGTPVQVAEQLQRFIDVGVEYLIVRLVDFPRPEGVHLFANEVVPLLQGR
jgi:alkanesulfonate monooxygenase SsuD/methylene tetrahydromethanopterin reductase-like flavin-dependent oxidoreductase (luciferase family)